jgi:hypothetical protein
MRNNHATLFFSDYLKEMNVHRGNKMNERQENNSFEAKYFLRST